MAAVRQWRVGPRPARLDRVAKAIYGTEQGGTVEALLDANRGLAALVGRTGMVPARTVLDVPAVQPTSTSTFVPPWS